MRINYEVPTYNGPFLWRTIVPTLGKNFKEEYVANSGSILKPITSMSDANKSLGEQKIHPDCWVQFHKQHLYSTRWLEIRSCYNSGCTVSKGSDTFDYVGRLQQLEYLMIYHNTEVGWLLSLKPETIHLSVMLL